jgi:sucrose phosphorylase
LLRGTAKHLSSWASQLSSPPRGCHFLNFTASHDGIGVRPLEGILPKQEILDLAEEVEKKGGFVSMRKLEDGSESPYELNSTYYSALSDPKDETLGEARFLCSQSVALAMRGIPAVYFHSICATSNDLKGVKETGRNRTINRKKWECAELEKLLEEKEGQALRVFEWYARILRRRAACPAFHPDAPQEILDFGPSIFALERASLDGSQVVLCLFNFQGNDTGVPDSERLQTLFPHGKARDLISGGEVVFQEGEFALRPYQALWLSSH